MFIKYNEKNVHALPHMKMTTKRLRNRKTGKVRTIQVVDSNLAPNDIKWLRPGWNEFPKDTWDQNKNNPGILKMLKAGKIEVLEEKVSFYEGRKKITKVVGIDDEQVVLQQFPEPRAIKIAKETWDRGILQRWLDEETRHKVKRVLEKQIKPLLSSESEEKEDDEDNE